MKRIFSGSKSPDGLPKSPINSPNIGKSILKTSGTFNQDNLTSKSAVSPELVPILTLLTAHTHRRYHEGVLLFLQDLKGDGSVGGRKWKEVYAVLIGTQLALWDAQELAELNQAERLDINKVSAKLKEAVSKPTYINFTDSTIKPLGAGDRAVTESGKKLENVLIVSSTLKNRYFLQFSNKDSFNEWHAALRLSLYECASLQMAYTGAFLSSRSAKLSDIKVLLADVKYDYEDWVSVRFGAGMPWKRCYAVISQPTKKNSLGEINFYESDKKIKKSNSMAKVISAEFLYAIYPSAVQLIDDSTIIKLEGKISFNKKEDPQDTTVFIMPEKHNAVPGYDTVIRFLLPAFNAFKLYGRPKKLKADKRDQDSLIFALPVLPHIYYLEVSDLIQLSSSMSSIGWDNREWWNQIRGVLQRKLNEGSSGCGSIVEASTFLGSPLLGSNDLFDTSKSIASPRSVSQPLMSGKPGSASNSSESLTNSKDRSRGSPSKGSNQRRIVSEKASSQAKPANYVPTIPPLPNNQNQRNFQPSVPAQHINNARDTNKSGKPRDLNIVDSNFNAYGKDHLTVKQDDSKKLSVASDLASLIEKYSDDELEHMTGNEVQGRNYNKLDRRFNDANPRQRGENDASSDEISEMARSINEFGFEHPQKVMKGNFGSSGTLPIQDGPDESNLFDPDYLVQDEAMSIGHNDAYGDFNNPYSSKFKGELVSPKIGNNPLPYPAEGGDTPTKQEKTSNNHLNAMENTNLPVNPYDKPKNIVPNKQAGYPSQSVQRPSNDLGNSAPVKPGYANARPNMHTPPPQGVRTGAPSGSYVSPNNKMGYANGPNPQQMYRPPAREQFNSGSPNVRGNFSSPVIGQQSPMNPQQHNMRPPPGPGTNQMRMSPGSPNMPGQGYPSQQPPYPQNMPMQRPMGGHPQNMPMPPYGYNNAPPNQMGGYGYNQRPGFGSPQYPMPNGGMPTGVQGAMGRGPMPQWGQGQAPGGKQRAKVKGGFSQFMPPSNTATNPYSNQ